MRETRSVILAEDFLRGSKWAGKWRSSDIPSWPGDSVYRGGCMSLCAGLGQSHLDRGEESEGALRS